MNPEDILFLFAGLVLLYFGAEGLVRGSSSAAIKMGIKPIIVGLTVVAFGTSAPELVVSLRAALLGNSSISMGNVIGSNIANIALILGISALIRPLNVNSGVIKKDIPIMIGISLLLVILLIDGELNFIDGLIFIAGIILYTFLNVYLARKERNTAVENEFKEGVAASLSVPVSIIFMAAGLALLVFGANIFVSSAVNIAKVLSISDAVIGLTVVAIGTSLPELVTSIVASYKNESDIAIGNVVGSNIFNILGILGITSVILSVSAKGLNIYDLAVMLLTAVILFPLSKTGFKISRPEGAFLLTAYLVYIYFLIP